MVGFKDKLLFSNNKREMTKDLEFFNRNKVSCPGGGGGVLPYITYTGMCRPTGS